VTEVPVLLILLACADEPACPGPKIDGVCYAATDDAPATPTDTGTAVDAFAVLAAEWEPCAPLPGNGELDLTGQCAFGVCDNQPYADAVLALGPPAEVEASYGQVDVSWSEGVTAYYADPGTGVPAQDALSISVLVSPDADAQTTDGLGPGVSMQCWVDALGNPDEIELQRQAKTWRAVSLEWIEDPVVKAWDFVNHRESEKADGESDYVSFY
jgi:hypothetical protein